VTEKRLDEELKENGIRPRVRKLVLNEIKRRYKGRVKKGLKLKTVFSEVGFHGIINVGGHPYCVTVFPRGNVVDIYEVLKV